MPLQMARGAFSVWGCTWDVPGPKWTICSSPGGQVAETREQAASEGPSKMNLVIFFRLLAYVCHLSSKPGCAVERFWGQ